MHEKNVAKITSLGRENHDTAENISFARLLHVFRVSFTRLLPSLSEMSILFYILSAVNSAIVPHRYVSEMVAITYWW